MLRPVLSARTAATSLASLPKLQTGPTDPPTSTCFPSRSCARGTSGALGSLSSTTCTPAGWGSSAAFAGWPPSGAGACASASEGRRDRQAPIEIARFMGAAASYHVFGPQLSQRPGRWGTTVTTKMTENREGQPTLELRAKAASGPWQVEVGSSDGAVSLFELACGGQLVLGSGAGAQ